MIKEIIVAILNAESKNDSKIVIDEKELRRKKIEIELKKGRAEYLESCIILLNKKYKKLKWCLRAILLLFIVAELLAIYSSSKQFSLEDIIYGILIPFLITAISYYFSEIANTSNVKISVEKELYETLLWLKLEGELDKKGESDLKKYTEEYIKESRWKKFLV